MRKVIFKAISVFTTLAMLTTAMPLKSRAADTLQATQGASQKIQAEFFVSTIGDDSNPGTYAQPFKTLDGARKAVRKVNKDMTGNIYVFFKEGTYYTPSTVTFAEEDSGTNGYNIIYKSLDEAGSAKIVGGLQVTSPWTLVDSNYISSQGNWLDNELPSTAVGHVYKAHIGEGLDLNTIYVNNERAILARYPNYEPYAGMPSAKTGYMRATTGELRKIGSSAMLANVMNSLRDAYKHGDLEAQIYAWDGGNKDWMTSTIPIGSVGDDTNNTLNLKYDSQRPWLYVPKYAYNTWGCDDRFFIQKNLGLLDVPDEFYYNNTAGDIYYYPTTADGTMNGVDVVYPTTENIINISGSSRDSMAHNIQFDGLTVGCTNFPDYYTYGWNAGDAGSSALGYCPPEACFNGKVSTMPSYCEQTERIEFQVGIFKLQNTHHISILNSHITNAGMFGIEMYMANDHNTVKNCLIDNMGHSSINIEGGYPGAGIGGDADGNGYSNNNLIDNCVLCNVGQLVGHGTGITLNNSGSNEISHLEVYNSPRRGIFITGGPVRSQSGGSATYPIIDANGKVIVASAGETYNAMNDLYTHDNHFDYIYMHNCQQDGGDDGALFTCYLYGWKGANTTDSKPNYFNQMVIDSTGANPTMHDGSPNNINFDMGANGIVCTDVKSVNPQNFNCENSNLGSQVSVENCNFEFQGPQNGLGTFDDSRMDYANIGVQTYRFPSRYASAVTNTKVTEPEDLYFKEDFEQSIDGTKWSYSGSQPTLTTQYMSEGVMGGRQALVIDDSNGSNQPVLYRNFSNDLNKIVSVKVFDKQLTHMFVYDSGNTRIPTGKTFAEVDDGTNVVALGIDPSENNDYYMMNIGGTETATSVPRVYGWHELKFDYSTPGTVKLYIDDTLVNTLDGTDCPQYFNRVSLGSSDGTGRNYYDQLYIYGGVKAPAPGSIAPTLPPTYDGSKNNIEQANWTFEDNQQLPSFTMSFGSSKKDNSESPLGYPWNDPQGRGVFAVVANPSSDETNLSNYVLKARNWDENGYIGVDDKSWNNYLINFDWKFDRWEGAKSPVLDNQYDVFNIGLMRTSNSFYEVQLKRNYKNSNSKFDGSFFELHKHTKDGDNDYALTALPEEFDLAKWHHVQISAFADSGKFNVTLIIDGIQIFKYTDTNPLTYGGIGFGGIDTTNYIDNVEIVTNPQYAVYDSKLGLGNVEFAGSFNPDYPSYNATITDPTKDVTIIPPQPVIEGTSFKYSLNDADITDLFADANSITPATIPASSFVNGDNKFIITQCTAAGNRDYMVTIKKPYTVDHIDIATETFNTTVGKAPVLPASTTLYFTDGTQQDNVPIVWSKIGPSLMMTPGTFEVNGTVSGYNIPVTAKVNVDGVISIDKLPPIVTGIGVAPILANSINVNYKFGGVKAMPITFDTVDPSLYAQQGTFMAVGHIDGYDGVITQLVTVGYVPEPTPEPPSEPDTNPSLTRLSGSNRVDTAIEIAKASHKGKVSNVILATANDYADALAGSVLAYKLNAPILLVGSSAADQDKVLSYMKENMDLAGTVYILGGIRAISTAVEEKITIGGFKNIKRLGGSDRYETSLKIAEQLDTKIGTPVVLVSGESYPDALSISSEAALMQYPILLTQKNGISDAIKSKIAEFKPIKVYIIGLQGAVSTAVEEQAVQITGLAKENIVRIGGSDRYETSLAVAKYFGISEQKVCIATGKNYPDALAGSVYAANNDAPIILVDEKLSDNITNYLKTRKVSEATIFGGESVVSKDLEDNLLRLLTK